MGLRKGDAAHTALDGSPPWGLLAGIAVVLTALAMLGDPGREWLRYDRAAIAGGQVWRLLTGHFVHLGWSHLALNLAGLALVWYLVAGTLSAGQWTLVLLACVAGIDLGFWFLEPQLAWYVGLSGVLHGVLAAGLAARWPRLGPESWVLAAALGGKLLYEQLAGPLPGSEVSAGGPVVTVAHLYGAAAGLLAGVLCAVRRRSAKL